MLGKSKNFVKNFFSFRLRGYEQIVGLLFLDTVLRIVISFYTSHPNDEEVWYITAVNMLSGQGSPYGTRYFSYPPVWAYIYLPFVSISSLFSNPYFFSIRINLSGTVVPVMSPLFNFVVKLPIIIGDIFVGLIIYRFVSNFKDEQAARKAFIFWFFNPLVIFTGAMVAQFDVLPALTSLLALVLFMQRKYFLAGASLGLGIMAKIYPIYFIPLYITFFFKSDSSKEIEWKKGIFRLMSFLAGILLTGIVLLLPILAFNSFPYFFEGIFRRGEYITQIGGLTPWNLIYLFEGGFEWINDYGRAQIIYTVLYILQMSGIALVSFHFGFRSGQEQRLRSLLRGHVCILTLIFLTILTVNPQYIIWVAPFLILSYGLYGNYKIRLLLLSASACFLAFYWAYPFYPIISYVNKEIGMMLYNALNLATNPIGFPLVIFFGLLGAITILLLPFPTPKISRLKTLLTRHRDEKLHSVKKL
jgi:Gpi18-like mannosyltransferase